MLTYLRDRSAQTVVRVAILRVEVADQTFYLTQSQYTDTGPTSSALTLQRQATGRVATGAPSLKYQL